MGETKNACKIIVAKRERKKLLERHRLEANNKMSMKCMKHECVVWIHMARDVSVAYFCEHGSESWVP
jgi:hypothetical protein